MFLRETTKISWARELSILRKSGEENPMVKILESSVILILVYLTPEQNSPWFRRRMYRARGQPPHQNCRITPFTACFNIGSISLLNTLAVHVIDFLPNGVVKSAVRRRVDEQSAISIIESNKVETTVMNDASGAIDGLRDR